MIVTSVLSRPYAVPTLMKIMSAFVKLVALFIGSLLAPLSLAEGFTNKVVVSPNPLNVRHNPVPILSPYDGIYSHGVETSGVGRYLHISGQLGFRSTGELPMDFRGQAVQAIENIKAVLASANMSISDVVQMRFYLVNRDDTKELIKVRTEMLNGLAPAVTTYIVGGLLEDEWCIEIEALAFQPSSNTTSAHASYELNSANRVTYD